MSMRNKSLCYLSSSPINELEAAASMKQGIVAILSSDSENNKAAASLRRTLSADMSSKKWLAQNGFFFPMKKIASSEELVIPIDSSSSSCYSSSSEDEEEYGKSMGQDDVWMPIQSQKERNVIQKPVEMNVWGSILSQKSENSSNFSPPYVHPLVKRSASVLSEQSLEICTESLGSETGSDGFCSDILSGGEEEEERQRGMPESNSLGNFHVVKYKKSKALPFPPPLSSIAGGDGVTVRIQSRRKNGRLILEAVSVPSKKYLHAHRQDGRLRLTLINGPMSQENKFDGFEQVFGYMEEVDRVIQEEAVDGRGDGGYEEEEAVEEKFEVSKEPQFEDEQSSRTSLSIGMINVNKKSSLMMKKILIEKFKNKAMNLMNPEQAAVMVVEREEEGLSTPQSLPPPPRVARLISSPPPPTASFNAYEYFWRQKTAASHGFINPMITTSQSKFLRNSTEAYEHQDLVLMKGNRTEYFVPYLKGCKESRRSLLIWEPYCIATS